MNALARVEVLDLILFGESGRAVAAHLWRAANPEWVRLYERPSPGESLIAAGFTGFEAVDAVKRWVRSPGETAYRAEYRRMALYGQDVVGVVDLDLLRNHMRQESARFGWFDAVLS